MNADGEEWGEERLIETIRACKDLKASEILTRIMQAAGCSNGFWKKAANPSNRWRNRPACKPPRLCENTFAEHSEPRLPHIVELLFEVNGAKLG